MRFSQRSSLFSSTPRKLDLTIYTNFGRNRPENIHIVNSRVTSIKLFYQGASARSSLTVPLPRTRWHGCCSHLGSNALTYIRFLALSYWDDDDIVARQDSRDWDRLTDNEQHFISMVLAFFAASDGIVMENLVSHPDDMLGAEYHTTAQRFQRNVLPCRVCGK